MMPGLRSRRRADEFNALVEGASTEGETSRAAERYADDLALVAQMRSVEPVEPRAEFVDSLRADLMAEATTVLTPTAAKLTVRPRRTTSERRVAAAVGGFAVVSASASMAVASQGALPGETLYPLKRAIERANTELQFDQDRRAAVLLEQASGRLGEAQALAGSDDGAELAGTLHDFSDQARGAADEILDRYQQDGDEQQVRLLGEFATSSHVALEDMQAAVPDSARPALIEATRVVEEIGQQVLYSCAGCGPDVAPVSSYTLTLDLLAGPPALPVEPKTKAAKQNAGKKQASAETEPLPEPASGAEEPAGAPESPEPEAPTDKVGKSTNKTTDSLGELTESVTGSGDGSLLDGAGKTVEGLDDDASGLLGQ